MRLEPALYLVATPIGNLRDITLRALDVLRAADRLLCEDSRVTGKLLNAFSIKRSLSVYNDHSTETVREDVLSALQAGQSVALVSDAGTPLVSDPGYKLVRAVLAAGLKVTALPGANAVLTGLQLSGLPSDAFSFIGFLPVRKEARRERLFAWRDVPGTLVLFESGPRLAESLVAMAEVLGDRPAAVIRELTKMFEESRRGSLQELALHYEQAGPPKGEIVVVIGEGAEDDAPDVDQLLRDALKNMSVRDASTLVASQSGMPKKDVYGRALLLNAQAKAKA